MNYFQITPFFGVPRKHDFGLESQFFQTAENDWVRNQSKNDKFQIVCICQGSRQL